MSVVVLLFFFIQGALATALVNRYQLLITDVLPDEVWTFGVSRGQSLGSGKASFGRNGAELSNQSYFSRNLTYGNLLDEVNDPLEQELAAAAFEVYGNDVSAEAGRVVNDVSVTQTSNTYVLGRGFGKSHSLFVIFPVVTLETTFKSRFEQSDSLLKMARTLEAEGQYQRAQEILEKSQNALSQRLSENGYKPSYPGSLTTLANIFLTHRYQALNKGPWQLTFDSTVVVPAGKKSDVDEFLFLRINEEQYSFKQGAAVSWNTSPWLTLLTGTYYHKRFPFERKRRIPRNNVSPLSNEIDPATEMRYGDTYGVSAQANFNLTENTKFYGGHSIERKDRDVVRGNRYSSDRYSFLASRTAQDLAINYGGISHNTIQSFLKKKFPIPVEANLQYSVTTSGRNTFRNEAVALNLMVFYK